MKDLTKYYIDLSKCSEDEQKHIFSLLPEPEDSAQYEIDENNTCLQYATGNWIVINKFSSRKELTYSELVAIIHATNQWVEIKYENEHRLPKHNLWLGNKINVWWGCLFSENGDRINLLATHYHRIIKPEPPKF